MTDRERRCPACGGHGFDLLAGAPEAVIPTGYRGEACRRCGKVELFVLR